MRGGAPCEGKTRMDVLKGDDVSLAPMNASLNTVEGYEVPWVCCLEILWFPQFLGSFPCFDLPEMRHLLGKHAKTSKILDDSSDGGNGRACESMFSAVCEELGIYLVFPEIGMFEAKSFDFSNDSLIPFPDSLSLWCP